MSTVLDRLEEVRTNLKTKVEEVRAGKGLLKGGLLTGSSSSGSSSSSNSSLLGTSILPKIREKGVMATLEERFPKIKDIRERKLLGATKSEGEKRGTLGEEKPKTPPPPTALAKRGTL